MSSGRWWQVVAAVVAVVVLAQVRGSGERPEVLDVPEKGAVAATLRDGTPVFVVVDGEHVHVLDARVTAPESAVGSVVGWCEGARRFVEPQRGLVFAPDGRVDPSVAPARAPRQPEHGPDGDPEPHGLRRYGVRTTGPGGSVQVIAELERESSGTTTEVAAGQEATAAYDGCLLPDVERFLPLATETEAASLPGLVTHAASAVPSSLPVGHSVVRAVLDRDGREATRMCSSVDLTGGRCPRDAPGVPSIGPLGMPGASVQVEGGWLVEHRNGTIVDLWHLPATPTDLVLPDVGVVAGRLRGLSPAAGVVVVDLDEPGDEPGEDPPHACGVGKRRHLTFALSPRASILGSRRLAGTPRPTALTARQLPGVRFAEGSGPQVRMALTGPPCRVVHLSERPQ